MSSLRKALNVRKSRGNESDVPRVPEGTGFLEAALILFGGTVIARCGSGETGFVAVDPAKQREIDRLREPGVLLDPVEVGKMMDRARREAEEFERRRPKRKESQVRSKPKSKDRMKSYSYQDPSD